MTRLQAAILTLVANSTLAVASGWLIYHFLSHFLGSGWPEVLGAALAYVVFRILPPFQPRR